MGKRVRSGYPSDVTDEEWSFVASYLALCREDAAQRDYPLRDVFNGLRYLAKTGNQWRFMHPRMQCWPEKPGLPGGRNNFDDIWNPFWKFLRLSANAVSTIHKCVCRWWLYR
jgi:transposase